LGGGGGNLVWRTLSQGCELSLQEVFLVAKESEPLFVPKAESKISCSLG